jgi:hypothetical protein
MNILEDCKARAEKIVAQIKAAPITEIRFKVCYPEDGPRTQETAFWELSGARFGGSNIFLETPNLAKAILVLKHISDQTSVRMRANAGAGIFMSARTLTGLSENVTAIDTPEDRRLAAQRSGLRAEADPGPCFAQELTQALRDADTHHGFIRLLKQAQEIEELHLTSAQSPLS